MNFMKLRKSGKLDIFSIITRTDGGTSKNTFVIHGKLRKKGFMVFCDLPTIQHSSLQLTVILLNIFSHLCLEEMVTQNMPKSTLYT